MTLAVASVCVLRQGHLSMVIQLLRYGADPSIADGEGYHALHLAILFQHMAIAAYLMAKGQVGPHTHATTHNPQPTTQHSCLSASLLFLSPRLQDVDEPDANGQTPVMLAALKIIG